MKTAALIAAAYVALIGGGMMRNVGLRQAVVFQQAEDSRWAQEVINKTYPTTDIIEERHNARYKDEITKVYGGN